MLKKFISSILIVILIMMSMPVIQISECLSSYAATTVWQYNFTGGTQNFTAPVKGIYQIEAYGAQGGSISNVKGGNGSYTTGRILLSKNQGISIYVGGQNGYNGGGAGNSYQEVGGGATDIRINGTATNNRILVAAGGGGAYSQVNYHQHIGNTSLGGDCYQTPNYHTHTDECQGGVGTIITWTGNNGVYAYFEEGRHSTATSTTFNATEYDTISIPYTSNRVEIRNNNDGDNQVADTTAGAIIKLYSQNGTLIETKQQWHQGINNYTTGNIEFDLRNIEGYCYFTADLYASATGVNMHKVEAEFIINNATSTVLNCGKDTTTPVSYSLSCEKIEGVTIDSYTNIEGLATSNSNGINYNGSLGGGGGYYGGKTRYAGTNFANTTYFTNTSSTTGSKSGNGYVKITLVSAYPEVTLSANTSSLTAGNVELTATATDSIVGLPDAPYSWNSAVRVNQKTYTVTKNGTYTVNVINNQNNTAEATIQITNIDKIKPIVNNIVQNISNDKRIVTLTVNATDSGTNEYAASGVSSYAITTTNTIPTSFQSSNTFQVTKNGTYYLWAKDAVGNISVEKTVLVKDIEVNIAGTITWNDQNNKYDSRKPTIINLYRKMGANGMETEIGQISITAGQTNYSIQTRACDDNGNFYTFRVAQNSVPGYSTSYTGNGAVSNQTQNITIEINNQLILPNYSSEVTMTPINSFENRYLKNSQVKVIGTITASTNNREKVGTCNDIVTLEIDNGVAIDTSSVIVKYIDKNGVERTLENYTLNGNTLTVSFEGNRNTDITAGDRLTIELTGTLNELKTYNNTIFYTGYLRDYQTGANTAINLGELTRTSNSNGTITVDKQLPEANINIKKTDSITEDILTDAEFTLYEWDGSKYVAKEIIKDTNNDGIYESRVYRWNSTTQGKYKIEETKVPESHKDSKFSMEYTLNQLEEENYTVDVDYNDSGYTIQYGNGNPDDLDSSKGIVENEPYKLKAQIRKIDKETGNIIESAGEFTIYEWNKEIGDYEEYVSYTNNQKVNMKRQEDKTYITEEWLYYTQKNEGKYRIIETRAPEGYYGDYNQDIEKKTYDINILTIITSGKYGNQSVTNEGTIIIENETGGNFGNTRVKAEAEIHVLDKESQKNVGQADSTLEGAVYGLYSRENIYHADGITSRYEGEKGLLYKKDELIMTKTTNEEGVMTFEDLECGIYYLKMITPPEGYLKNENIYGINLNYQGEEVEKVVLVGKVDIQVKKQAFQIYKLKENLTALNNAGFSIYLISDLQIVKDGSITKVTSNTYKLNDEKAKKDSRLEGKANEDGTYNLPDLIDYYYKRYEGNEENATTLPGDETNYYPYNMSDENYVKDYKDTIEGEDIVEQKTNESGYLKSTELAYGEYIILETSVPRNQDVTNPFIVKVEEDSRDAQDIRFVIDNNFRTRVKIYKKDAETKQTILQEQAQYVIRNVKTNELMTKKIWTSLEGYVEYGTLEHPFETNKTGYLITPMELEIGEYVLEEVKAPEGYTLNGYEGISENGNIKWERQEKLRFSINTNTAYYTDTYLGKYVIVVNQENKSAVGTIKIKTAQGEFLSNAIEKEPYEFNYEKRPVEGAKYKVCARENIYTQDNQGTLLYSKDEIVTYITTNSNGEAIVENLPLGKYYIKEVEPAEGFSLSQEETQVELIYEGQEVPVVFREVAEEEIRQKIEIVIHNKDSQTQEKRIGGTYGLYTKEEISYKNSNGEVKTIPEEEKIITLIPNEEGIIEINKDINVDLPKGKYYLKEIEAPQGYVKQEEELEIDASKEKLVEIIHIEKDFYGTQTKVAIKEVNEEEEITTGSNFEIRKKETGEVERSFTTKGIEEVFRKLETNVEYVLVETKPAKGYTTAEEVNFIIKENGKLWIEGEEQEENLIVIRDYKTKLEVNLRDEITKEYACGSKLQIIRKLEENGETKEEVIEEWTTEGDKKYIEKLEVGEYILREVEIEKGSGYVSIEEVEFRVEDTKEVQVLDIEQKISKVRIGIIDEETKEKINNLEIEIVEKETGKVVAKTEEKKNDEKIEEDEKIEDKVISEEGKEQEEKTKDIIEIKETGEGYYIERLPIGEYIIKEKTKEGYKEVEDVEMKVEDTRELQIIKIENKRLIYDIQVEKELESITIDGERKKIEKGKMQKVEIQESKINTTEVLIEYVIRVKNVGETKASVGNIIENIPNGFTVESEGWIEKEKQLVWEKDAKEELEAGESKEVKITLRWENNMINFGEKINTAKVEGSTNPYGYEDKNKENDIGKETTMFSIKTGEETNIQMKIIAIILITLVIGILICVVAEIEELYIRKK